MRRTLASTRRTVGDLLHALDARERLARRPRAASRPRRRASGPVPRSGGSCRAGRARRAGPRARTPTARARRPCSRSRSRCPARRAPRAAAACAGRRRRRGARSAGRSREVTGPPPRARRAGARGGAAPPATSRSWVMTTIVVPSPCSSRSSASTPAPERESRFPVGSSAKTIDGRATTARAIATRWRSPPDSSLGRWVIRCPRPTRSSAVARGRRALGQRGARVEQPLRDVLHRAHPVEEEELLEDEADPPRPQAGELALAERRDVRARHLDAPARRAARASP